LWKWLLEVLNDWTGDLPKLYFLVIFIADFFYHPPLPLFVGLC
jgi:hypothetical protein